MKLKDFEINGVKVMGDSDMRITNQTSVKFGIDPTAPDLHLGHMVALRQLRKFQDAGVEIQLIIGEATAQIGDPTGRDATRPSMGKQDVLKNHSTYLEQMSKIIRREFTVWYNSDTITAPALLDLASRVTISKMMEHATFSNRIESSESIRLHELLYPLIQAYDSILLRNHIEVGGSDQTFNFTITRDIQRSMGLPQQSCLIVPILLGTDGKRKMSKSLNNYVAFNDAPDVMRDKLSRMPDSNVESYMNLLTDLQFEDFTDILTAKKILIRSIIGQLHGLDAAFEAMENYGRKKKVTDGK